MKDSLSEYNVFLLLDEIKAMARGALRRVREASLQTTALVLSALWIESRPGSSRSSKPWPSSGRRNPQ
jgi:hypothetical protein